MRGESPKSYKRVARARPTSCCQLYKELEDRGAHCLRAGVRCMPLDDRHESICVFYVFLCILFVIQFVYNIG